jgi:hypothetical protein
MNLQEFAKKQKAEAEAKRTELISKLELEGIEKRAVERFSSVKPNDKKTLKILQYKQHKISLKLTRLMTSTRIG